MPEGFLNPENVLQELSLQSSMIAADFGCGSGGWAIPLSKTLSEGRVYAIDLIEGPLKALESTAKMSKIINIQTMVADVEKGTKVPAGSCDLVLMTNVLFQCKDKKAVLAEAKRILKPDGKSLVVEWKKSVSFGPRERSVLPQAIKDIAKELSLKPEKEFEAGVYHYGIIFAKA
jgi:ubiquinone/menaquinone biosynthesis C-methylase UbiE